MSRTIAVIGAGMAGAAAARRLADAGYQVTVFDKGRGVGGRMATRRAGGFSFDHGAQYMRSHEPAFAERLARWRAQGLVADWGEGRDVGVPAMNAPVKALLEGIRVELSVNIGRIERTPSGWRLQSASGAGGASPGLADASFDLIVVAIPSVQAGALLASHAEAAAFCSIAEYAPCWALMLGFETSPDLPDALESDDAAISWIASEEHKPGRSAEGVAVVVHGSPQWSRENLESDRDSVIGELYARFRGMTGIEQVPVHGDAHRWRYARVERAAPASHLWLAKDGIALCGDWCLGPRIEAAFESGLAAAAAILGEGQP